jgi:dUTP pyrophosphatase
MAGQTPVWIALPKHKKIWENAARMEIAFRRLSLDVPVPEYKTPGAAAFDLAVIEEAILAPGERKLLRTGLVVKVPAGHVLILAPRSSNAKKGIQLANGIGVIDQDYCGPEDELRLFLVNIGSASYTVEKGERIAQGMFFPVTKGTFTEPMNWNVENNRGGFGTTG